MEIVEIKMRVIRINLRKGEMLSVTDEMLLLRVTMSGGDNISENN